VRIGLLGPCGRRDLGDAAIREAVVAAIRRYQPGATVTDIPPARELTSARDRAETPQANPRSAARERDEGSRGRAMLNRLHRARNPVTRIACRCVTAPVDEAIGVLRAARFVSGLDLLMVPGESGMDDAAGGPWQRPYSLVRWAVLARLVGTPVAFVSIGGGSIGSLASRTFARAALSLATYRSYRDLPSRTQVAEVTGFRRDDPVVPDLAYSLPADFLPGHTADTAGRVRPVAIGPISSTSRHGHAAHRQYIDRLAAVAAALARESYPIALFPGDATYDGRTIDRVREAALRLLPPDLHYRVAVVETATLADVLTCMAQADYVITFRYHSALLAHLLGKPTLALARPGAIRRLMRDAGVGEYCLDIERAAPEEILGAFAALERERVNVQERLAAYTTACRGILERQYRELFSGRTLGPETVPGRRRGLA